MTGTGIHSRALLAALNISSWAARKFDAKVTKEVNDQHAASRDAGRFNKKLLPGEATSYKTLTQTIQDARKDHYANTLAWSDEGWRLLPSANYLSYTSMMRKHGTTFDRALAEFVADYPHLKEAAKVFLNGMYREQDYPTPQEIEHKFNFGLAFSPLPAHGDFRLDLPETDLRAIEAQVQDRVAKAARDAMDDAWTRLRVVVANMHERLTDKKSGIFRDTLVTNLRDLVDILSRLNVTDDADLEAMRQRVERELSIYDPQELRDDPSAREATAKAAGDILAAMSQVYGGAR